ncbi:MAG: hypothetical protein ACE5NM_12075 [Sedimentisphaerales bacterium]
MTIQFNCPHCNALIAFDEKHCGKRARCLTCGQLFIIPSTDYKKPQKIKLKVERAEPLPGFYWAAFVDNWKLFARPQNATGLVFVAAAVCFKFFVGHTDYSFTMGAFRVQAPTGLIVRLAAWGCLFWYYMEIIYSTAFNVQELPDVYMGGLFGFIWNVVKSLFIFATALVVVELPCIIFIVISRNVGIEWPVVSHLLALAGLFAFPMAILTLSIGRDIAMLRPDHILEPISKAFWAYVTVFGVFALAWELQLHTVGYGELLGTGKIVVGLNLLANIMVQALAIISMRSIGLFYRHYSCYFHW